MLGDPNTGLKEQLEGFNYNIARFAWNESLSGLVVHVFNYP